MSATSFGALSVACLAAGAVDLAVLNVMVLPKLDQPTVQVTAVARREVPKLNIAAPLELASSVAAPEDTEPPPQPALIATVDFDKSAHHVNQLGRSLLQANLSRLQAATEILVVGHADASGPDDLNERLSESRAATVARRLVELGIARRRIRVEARGEREPRADGNSRRVEIYLGEAR